MRANQDIRERAKKSGVCQWEIAETLGISETHLCRKLRKELPEDEKQKKLDAREMGLIKTPAIIELIRGLKN